MRRSAVGSGGGAGAGPGHATSGVASSTHGKGKICASALAVLLVIAFVVTIPPMKAKQYLATENGADVAEVQRILVAHQRQQVLDEDDIGALNMPDQLISEDHPRNLAVASSDPSAPLPPSAPRRKIDLTIYIIFHKVLHDKNYASIQWSGIALPIQADNSANPTTLTTASVVAALSSSGGANRTTIVFVSTNKKLKKRYSPDLVRGRLINEWELPGYDTRIGALMNEYGAMNSIFSSQLTQHAGNIANVAGRGTNPRLIAADADGDGVQEWIGVFQYDMRIDQKLLQLIRRRIRSKTAAAITTLSTTNNRGEPRRASTHLRLHCCIFYGVSYPTRYLLHNALGRKLVEEYNSFFGTTRTLADMPTVAILDAFVVPTIVFNHFAPFLESVMLRVIRSPSYFPPKPERASRVPPETSAAPSGASTAANNNDLGNRAHALDVMEAALAVALGFETLFVQVQLPLRHKSWEDTA